MILDMHNAFLFEEFELTSTFKASYLLIGKNAGGFNLILIDNHKLN